MKQQATKPKAKPNRRSPAPHEYKPLGMKVAFRSENTAGELPGGVRLTPSPAAAPSPSDIEAALRRQPAQTCPSAKVPKTSGETWREAWVADLKLLRQFGQLVVEAVIAVVAPLLTAAVDGLGILIAAVTVWELWRPAVALADWLMSRWPGQ